MGEWLMPDPVTLLSDVLDSPAFAVPPDKRAALALALQETGFLVAIAYYVPDVDELFDIYHQLTQHFRRPPRLWIRWVMCGETQQALYRKYGNTRYATPSPNLVAFMEGGDLTTTSNVDDLVAEVDMMVTRQIAMSVRTALDAGRLFGMPIRRDPAARRPLLELFHAPTEARP